jgi:hypothetical protein
MFTRFEDLPNELFFSIFIYFDIRNLYRSFWGLNYRFNNLVQSVNDLSLVIENNELLLIEIFARHIYRLKIVRSQSIDLSEFSNLSTLELCQANYMQLEQIRSDLMPKLVDLSISAPFHISIPLILIEEIFSNAFRFLQQVKLPRIDHLPLTFDFQAPSLRSLRITCVDITIIPRVLNICPNLSSFNVTFFGENHYIPPPESSTYNHQLEKFTLDDPYHKLTFETIDNLFLYIPNIKSLSLWFQCRRPFIDLINSILTRLNHLIEFDCEILESPNDQMIDIELIQEMHECFHNLQCFEKPNNYRLNFTE